jgi:hypothetical protein
VLHKKNIRFAVITVLITGSIASGIAQQPSVTVESRMNKSLVTVGELIQYDVIVKHTKDVTVTMPPPGINLGGFEIRDYQDAEPVVKNNVIERKVEYIVAAYDTGTYVIPPTGVLYVGADSVKKVLLTDSLTVRVESILTGDARDILDIKNPLYLSRNWKSVLIVSFIGILVLLAGVLGYLYYRRKKSGKGGNGCPPLLPAHEEAYSALEQLKNSPLLAENRIKEYYIKLSEIIRQYLQRRYFQPILEMTTLETLSALEDQQINQETLLKIEELLSISDLVKFAKLIPESDNHQRCFDLAYEIVTETKLESFAPPAEQETVETVTVSHTGEKNE